MTQTVPLAHLATSRPTAAESSSRKTLSALALAVAKAKRIVVVTGAGISCSSGIPDFRSSDGLYNLVKSRYPDAVLKGRDLFDAALFRDPTSSALFYTFMAELKTQIDSAQPAPVHDFLTTLDFKGKLLRSYTQNIDGLEERAGLRVGESDIIGGGVGGPRPKNIQLHGDIHRVRCTLCSASYPCAPEHINQFRTGTPPDCPECTARSDARTARSARALKCGTLRPAIVLYDEPHPLGDHIGAIQTSDLGKKPDLLIIMGTSLKVHGLRRLVKSFAKAVHSSRPPTTTSNKSASHSLLHNVLFVNRTAPPPGEWTGVIDYHVQGDADMWVAQVLGEWKKSRPADWEVQATLDEVNIGRVIKGLGAPGASSKAKVGKAQEDGHAKKKGKATVAARPKGKGGSKVGVENTPPDDNRPASQQTRCVIVLPRRSKFKLGINSPLKTRGTKSSVKASSSLRIGLSKSPGLGGGPVGHPCQLGMSSPRRLGAIRTSLKRPAPSPLAPRQARLEDAFQRSPVSKLRVSRGGNALSSTMSCGASSSSSQSSLSSLPSVSDGLTAGAFSTDTSSMPSSIDCSSSSSSPSLKTLALSSQEGLALVQDQNMENSRVSAPPSQASSSSTSSSQPSIFTSQRSRSTLESSQSSFSVSSQGDLSCSQVSAPRTDFTGDKPYLGQPRPPPFRHRDGTIPTSGLGPSLQSTSSGSGSQPFPSRTQRLSSTGPFSQPDPERGSGTAYAPRRATTIPIPGRDFVISKTGEKVYFTSGEGRRGNRLEASASQVSDAPPPTLSQSSSLLSPVKGYMGATKSLGIVQRASYWDEGSPRKRGQVGESQEQMSEQEPDESEEGVEDESDMARGLLFDKGKGIADMNMDVIDLVSDDEDREEDNMDLDCAVGHMSLDGPVDTDGDVDVEGISDSPPSSLVTPLPLSPVQTRAGRRAKEAVKPKRGTGKAPRVRIVGARTSSRLAAMKGVGAVS